MSTDLLEYNNTNLSFNWIEELKDITLKSLEDNKAENIVIIDLTGKSDIAKYMIIAAGDVNRHVTSIANNLLKKLKEEGYGHFHLEGRQNSEWILLDLNEVLVHIFQKDIRLLYNLEKMWGI